MPVHAVLFHRDMEHLACADSRAHGMFQFYGANRTGRYSGRIIQLQNLPQNHIPDLAQARELVKAGDFDALSMLYEDIPDTLPELRDAWVGIPPCRHKRLQLFFRKPHLQRAHGFQCPD